MRGKTTLKNRLLSLLLTAIMVLGMIPATETHVHAGGISDYEIDGRDYTVAWGDEHGVGCALIWCEYCGESYYQDFDDGDHEEAASAIISNHFRDCGHCEECADDLHCPICEKCFEVDAEECPLCNSMICLDCHYDEYYCDVCGNCRLVDGADGLDLTGHCPVSLPGLDSLCGDCLDNIDECSNCSHPICVGGEWFVYDETGQDWCKECFLCPDCLQERGAREDCGHCVECGVCGEEETVCDECHMCWTCAVIETHCPECDLCWGEGGVEYCPSGGFHCIECDADNDWICSQCDECMQENGREMCDDCGLCEECCLANSEDEGCTHGYCVVSSEYLDHACVSCGLCPDDNECEYCGFCEECQYDYHCDHEICPENDDEWEEHLCENCGDCFELEELCELCHMCESCWEHCDHELCPEDFDYEDHFCDQCGDCYEDSEFCDECGLCIYCCEENTEAMGCNHELCVESDEFRAHYCFADRQCLALCNHDACSHENVGTAWTGDMGSHWRVCSDCGAAVDTAAHTAGAPVTVKEPNPKARTNGTARISCTVCGQSMGTESIPYVELPADGSPIIYGEPTDYTGKVSDVVVNGVDRYATFTVKAAGDGLSYQWYMYRPEANPAYQIKKLENSESLGISGAQTNRLKIYVYGESCHEDYRFYCVVSNANGTVESRRARMDAQHVFGHYEDNGDYTHSYFCLGEGCTETQGGSQRHHYGEAEIIKIATSTEEGTKRETCLDCGFVANWRIPKVPADHTHIYTTYKSNEKYHWGVCSCGLTGEKTGHRFQPWQTTLEPTETREGQQRRYCAVCHAWEYGIIEKLPHTHDFVTLIKAKNKPYELPNGGIDGDYHYRYCKTRGCFATHKELHSYNAWKFTSMPHTEGGTDYPGMAYRYCTECHHSDVQTFAGKWPILTEVIGGVTGEGFGGASIEGPVAASYGEKVTLTVKLEEGMMAKEDSSLIHGWSLYEVSSTDEIKLYGTYVLFQNRNLTDFKVDPNTYTATFTMPNGPVALAFAPQKCDHAGAGTYADVVEPSCTVAGANVRRCSRCHGIVETVSRIEPKGHRPSAKPIDATVITAYCSWFTMSPDNEFIIHPFNDPDRRGYTGDSKCLDCGKILKGRRTPIVHGADNALTLQADPEGGGYWYNVFEIRNEYDETCVKWGYEGDIYCKLCGEFVMRGERLEPLGHNWSGWETIQEPTTKLPERQKRECARCDAVQYDTGDYAGPDYNLKADKTRIHFDFTYGDAVAPQTVTFRSVGRDAVSSIKAASEQIIGGVVGLAVDGMKVTVTPDVYEILNNLEDKEIVTVDSVLTPSGEALGSDEFTASEITVTANIKKTAQKYNITVEGGTVEAGGKKGTSLQVHGGEELKVIADDGMNFARWEVTDASGLVAARLDDVGCWMDDNFYLYMSPNDVTLRALYKNEVYTVSFDKGEGSGSMADVYVKKGETLKLPACTFKAPDGKEFDRWDKGAPGDEITVSGDMTVTALWKDKVVPPTVYTVSFNANSGGGTMADVTVNEGEKLTLPACTFDPPSADKIFDKWDAGAPGEQVEITADCTITAIWKNKPVTKTLDGIAVTTPPTKTTYTAGQSFDKAGMVVTATYSDSTTAPVTSYTVTPSGALATTDTSVTISYTEGGVTKTATQAITVNSSGGGGGGGITTRYTLTYNTNGGSTVTATKHNSGATVNLTATPTKEGFTFDGWYSDAALTNKITSVTMDGNKTVYAGWKETGTSGHDCPSAHLKDIDPNAWYHEYVDYVVEKGLMQGVADDLFAPNVTTSRAMIVTILHRLEGKPAASGKASFDDVAAGSWYADAVAWAEANDIVNGYDAKTFGPMDPITREQFAAIMYRYANFKGYDTGKAADLSGYADASAISDWALAAMKWANAENLITGRTATTLVPRGDATRAEAAAILKRFIENVK